MPFPDSSSDAAALELGLRENWQQFSLLVLVNAFVGAMVGMERVLLPLLGQQEFGIVSRAAILSFIVSFGLTKAIFNLAAGRLTDSIGRKPVLITGWLLGLPVPLLIFWAPGWEWIVLANVFLGINQGLCWSTTVIMKIDLAGPRRRGLAMGLNEASGYLAVAAAAAGSGYLAAVYGLRLTPLYIGSACALSGLLLSAFFVRESLGHARQEASERPESGQGGGFKNVFGLTSWRDKTLFSVCQAGLAKNLNDGMAWGIFPLFFAAHGLPLEQISLLGGIYPAVWGLMQPLTGFLSDWTGRKPFIAGGMFLQGLSILGLVAVEGFLPWVICTVLLGLGTAMVYPTLLAVIGDVAHPNWRASSVGVYRLWRDVGYAVGALLSGILADSVGMPGAIVAVGTLTLLSGLIASALMRETAFKL